MKLYLHSWYLNVFMALDFWYSLENQVPALMEGMFEDAVKEVQLYDDYGLRNRRYPFSDDDHYYYPLSVIMKKKYVAKYGDYRIVWLRWRKDALRGYNEWNPFSTVGQIPFGITQTPPAAFLDIIAKKPLLYYERSGRKVHCTMETRTHREWGNVAQSFMDVFGAQISDRLHELVPQNKLTNHWNLRTCVYHATVEHDGWFYRPVKLLNPHAEALVFAVKWQEPVDMTDEITDKDIRIFIAEDCSLFRTESITLLKQFLVDGTYVFSGLGNQCHKDDPDIEELWRRALDCDVEFDASWPDVVCELHFSTRPDLSEIAELFSKYASSYNRWHSKPIHYISDPIADDETVRIHIDFGDADPKAMELLVAKIKKAKWPLIKVCFS